MQRAELLTLLLEQHHQLRGYLAAIDEEARLVARRKTPQGCVRLRKLIAEMRRKLVLHVSVERDALVPLLYDIDAWGPERLRRLKREHDIEHELLESSVQQTASTVAPKALAAAARRLTREIAAHMDIEERDFLNRSVLNDDMARVEFTG